jgi:hypothetical protein
MAADRSYVAENQAQLERLQAVVDRLSDRDLAHSMDAGWTVAGVLAHLAFWDYRIVTLLDGWGPDGRGTRPPSFSENSVDWVNDAGKPLCLALAPREAARLAVAAAKEADRRVAGLSEALIAANSAAGNPINVDRAEHRREHLDEIEEALSRR